MTTNRKDIIQKIANLRALSENNTSENEAMQAMARAERLMHSYRVDEAELAMAEAAGEVVFEIIEESTSPLRVGNNRHKVHVALGAITKFTDTECVIHGDKSASFTGDRPDVEMAIYLTDLIREALDSAYTQWRRSQPNVGRGAKASFQMSMACRVSSRLSSLKETFEPLPQEHVRSELTSTTLVVASINEEKLQRVKAEFKARYPRLRASSGFSYRSSANASAGQAGRDAGDKVNFGRPVSGANSKAIAAE